MEIEKSSNLLDLRFVPDDTEFEHPPKEVAKEVPSNYKQPDWFTKALQLTNPELTWDADDHQRVQLTTKKFTNKDDIRELDFQAYLASSSDEVTVKHMRSVHQ